MKATRRNDKAAKYVIAAMMLFTLLPLSSAGTPSQWKERTIYQILTDRFALTQNTNAPCSNLSSYCGGSYAGAIEHLDYIAGMGFDAIWISPIVENTPNGYHGYWAQNFYQLNPFFGSNDDFANFIRECHSRNIWVMVDVVANHVGPVGYDYSSIVPFNDPSHYHSCSNCPSQCTIQDYSCFTYQVENCRTSGLPDLNQTLPYVQDTLLSWIEELVEKSGADGLRIDTIPEIAPDFWGKFQEAAGVYGVGEVFSGDVECVGSYSHYVDGVMSYPMYFTLKDVFQQGRDMNELNVTLDQYRQYMKDPSLLGNFIDNHDNPRYLCTDYDLISYKAALTWVLLSEGIPIIYYGTEQMFDGCNDPSNREPLWPSSYNEQAELYEWLKVVIEYRKEAKVWNYPQIQRYLTNNFYAFTRGDTLVALTNQKNNIEYSVCFTPYSNGQLLCNLFYTSDCVTVTNGCVKVYLNGGETKIFYPVN